MENELKKDPLWYKHAVIYQLHVRGFYDKNDDGIGDFTGLTEKLDYLESLGITAIWLLPFYPSPLKDDGYDISNYLDINPNYGTLKDFKKFLKEAHRRKIKVITELVINHTSDQHPWFQRARYAKSNSAWRNFYVWSDTSEKYKDARIIFSDFESSNWTWDPVAKAYYWHRFYYHQPDLNFESPHVQKEIFKVLDFWLKMGVDGFRLDAIPYLYEQEGTNCENLESTHQFLKKLRHYVDTHFQEKVLIAEANQWPEDVVAYFGMQDECHMAFHFPLMPRLFMAVHMEDRFPIIDILEQTPPLENSCQWVMFLRNHDELTLEMVSDEERDYMYRIYAKDPKSKINLGIRRRLSPLLDNDRAKIELMNILLLSLPGTPVIYYGDEIGMGDNYYLGDRNGVRTPMQWNSDRNAGFSKVNPQKLFLPLIIDPLFHYELINVDNEEKNSSSLLWWIRRMLLVYKNNKAFGFGSLEFLLTENYKILAFIRTYESETILVIANLSRFSQATELDLKKYIGYTPYEMFNQNPFPIIKENPYNITLRPYNYFWLSLKPNEAIKQIIPDETAKLFTSKGWKNVLKGQNLIKLETSALPHFLKNARWFERKTCKIKSSKIISSIALDDTELCLIEISYLDIEEVDLYLLALTFLANTEQINPQQGIIAYLKVDEVEGVLVDAIYTENFRRYILHLFLYHKKIKDNSSELLICPGEILKKKPRGDLNQSFSTQTITFEQSNSSLIYGQAFFIKLYRKLQEGIHPDIEIMQMLYDKAHFPHIPPYMGSLKWILPNTQPIAIAILEQVIPNEGTGWSLALDVLKKYYEQVLILKNSEEEFAKIKKEFNLKTFKSNNSLLMELIGGNYLELTRILGQRTAEMHLALAACTNDPNFIPVPNSILYQRSLHQEMRSLFRTILLLIEKNNTENSDNFIILREIMKNEKKILGFFQQIIYKKFDLLRIRIHGDFHLGQVLYTGKDFSIIDFEGEPLRSITYRRTKRFALRDVAGMMRSFHYAAHKVLRFDKILQSEGVQKFEPWADLWYEVTSSIFLQSYIQTITAAPSLLPKSSEDTDYLLKVFILEKAFYELAYELNTRPDWVIIPLKGIQSILQSI